MGDDDIFSRLGHSKNPLESNINFLKWKRTTNYTYNCLIQKEISKKCYFKLDSKRRVV